MGVVYAAVAADGTRLAVKAIRAEYAGDPAFRARFAREVALMLRVTGPCLVPLVAADTDARQPWLATPFVPGVTLAARAQETGPLSGTDLVALAAGVAAALSAVHAAGIVHRDLKPTNVILAPAGPRVLDFGIAHALDETSITRTGAWTGTPGWTSPEQYLGAEGGPASDVFGWGALIAYAATGRAPFGSGRPDAVAYRVLHTVPDLSDLPASLVPHVEAALAKDPADRPSAAGLAQHLGALLSDQKTVATGGGASDTLVMPPLDETIASLWSLGATTVEPAWSAPRVRRRAPILIGAALLAFVAGGAIGVEALGMQHPSVKPGAAASTGRSAPVVTATRSGSSPTEGRTAAGSGPSGAVTPSAAALYHSDPHEDWQPDASVFDDAPTWRTSDEQQLSDSLKTAIATAMADTNLTEDEVRIQFDKTHESVLVTLVPLASFNTGAAGQGVDEFQRVAVHLTCQSIHERLTGEPAAWPYGRYVVAVDQLDPSTGLTNNILAYGDATNCQDR